MDPSAIKILAKDKVNMRKTPPLNDIKIAQGSIDDSTDSENVSWVVLIQNPLQLPPVG
jgi:hypothetical protein